MRSRQPQTSKQGLLNPSVEEAEGNGWGSAGGVDFLQKTWELAGYPPGLKAVQSYFRHCRTAGQPSPRAAPLGNTQDAAETRMLLKSPQTILAKAAGGKHGELAKVLPQETVCPSRPLHHPNYRRPPPAAPRPGSPRSLRSARPPNFPGSRRGAAAPGSAERLEGSAPGKLLCLRGTEGSGGRSGGEKGGKCRKPWQQGRQEVAGGAGKVLLHLLLLLPRDQCSGLGERGRRLRLASLLTSVLSAAFSAIFLLRSRQREECFIPIRASQGVGASGLVFWFVFSKISKHWCAPKDREIKKKNMENSNKSVSFVLSASSTGMFVSS